MTLSQTKTNVQKQTDGPTYWQLLCAWVWVHVYSSLQSRLHRSVESGYTALAAVSEQLCVVCLCVCVVTGRYVHTHAHCKNKIIGYYSCVTTRNSKNVEVVKKFCRRRVKFI